MANKSSRVIHWGVMQKLVLDTAGLVQQALSHIITPEEAHRQLRELERQAYIDDPLAEPDGEITHTVAMARERLDKKYPGYQRPAHNDIERVNWMESHPNLQFTHHATGPFSPYWRKVFGPKDATNRFKTLRDAIDADIDGKIR